MKKNLTTLLFACLSMAAGLTYSQSLTPIMQNGQKAHKKSFLQQDVQSKRPNRNYNYTYSYNNSNQSISQNIQRIPAIANHADSVILYGMHIQTNDWQTTSKLQQSMYSFQAAPEITFKQDAPGLIFEGTPITAFYAKEKFYVLRNETDGVSMETYNANSWEKEENDVFFPNLMLMQASSYDPQTDKVYLTAWGANWLKDFLALDLSTCKIDTLAQTNKYPIVLAAHSDGNLYTITSGDNMIWKVDKTTGELTEVAQSDQKWQNANASQYAVVDWAKGIWYMVGLTTDYQCGLYTIDPKSGKSTLLTRMPSDERFRGLFIPETNPLAPAAPTRIRMEGENLCFATPSTTYNGSTLNGTLTACITIDGTTSTFDVTSGSTVKHPINLSNGSHEIELQLSNVEGKSPMRRLKTFVGADVPAAVENLSFTLSDEKIANLTWDAPSKSMNGGVVDDASIRYKVIREPNSVVVSESQTQTTFTEVLTEARHNYYYRVIAMSGNNPGGEAASNAIKSGTMYVPPFVETFDAREDFNLYKVIDQNADYFTWIYSTERATCLANYDVDDYLITPSVELKKDYAYRISFNFGATMPEYSITYKVLLCNEQNITGNEKEIGSVIINQETGHYSTVFLVEENKNYHIAIHAISDISASTWIDDLSITIDAEMTAPAGVTNLTLQAGSEGALNNTITFKAPTKTYEGNTLNQIDKIDVFQKSDSMRLVKTFIQPQPGETLSFTQNDLQQGIVTYSIRAYNEFGQGEEVTASNYVGLDYPLDITNVKAVMTDNQKAYITWDNPGQIGENGGYVNPDDIYYSIYRYQSTAGKYVIIADNVKETTFTDEDFFLLEDEQQRYVNYNIYANNATGSSWGYVLGITLGTPYELPYQESFTNAGIDTNPWTIKNMTSAQAWNIVSGLGTVITPYDKDGGMVQFTNSTDETVYQSLLGPRISLLNSQKPALVFYMYHGFEAEEGDLTLTVQGSFDDGEFIDLASIEYNNGEFGWKRHVVSLDEYTNCNNVQFMFSGYAVDGSASITLDQLTVSELQTYDLAFASYSAPKRINYGESGKIQAEIINLGYKAFDSYTVELWKNDALVQEQTGEGMQPNQVIKHEFTLTPELHEAAQEYVYSVKLVSKEDNNTDNNTQSAAIYINGPKFPKVNDLNGSVVANAGVQLTWSTPNAQMLQAKLDDFESYEAFIIDGIGEWKTVDIDQCATLYFGSPNIIPNQWDPQAWQVWNWVDAGFTSFEMCAPHSGNQGLTAWGSADNENATPLPNDNWLISPEVAGGSDVSIWVKEINVNYGPEHYEILYSTTNDEPESFVKMDEGVLTTDIWQELVYTLPEDAKYFAIRHCTQENGLVMMIDDITYTPLNGETTTLSLKGFNVYRDNILIAENVASPNYTDTKAEAGIHEYRVSVVWSEGESLLSNIYTADVPVGIGENNSDAVQVYTENHAIVVANATGLEIRVLTTDGKFMNSIDKANTMEYIEVPQGIYLITVGDEVYKVLID